MLHLKGTTLLPFVITPKPKLFIIILHKELLVCMFASVGTTFEPGMLQL